MSSVSQRDALDHVLARVPALVRAVSRGVRQIPAGSRLRRRLIEFQLRRAFAAMARSDVELVVLVYEPDAEVLMRGMAAVGVNESYRGHDGVRALYADVDDVFSDWRWTVRAIADGGDRLAIRCDFFGHGRGSGADTDVKDAGTAVRLSEAGLVTWQGWFVEQGGWEQALEAVGLSEPV